MSYLRFKKDQQSKGDPDCRLPLFMEALPPFQATSMVIPPFPVILMAFLAAPKACACIPPIPSLIPMVIVLNCIVVRSCSLLHKRTHVAIILSFKRQRDASNISISSLAGSCASPWIGALRFTRHSTPNERMQNASIVRLKDWASSDQKCAISTLLPISIPLFMW